MSEQYWKLQNRIHSAFEGPVEDVEATLPKWRKPSIVWEMFGPTIIPNEFQMNNHTYPSNSDNPLLHTKPQENKTPKTLSLASASCSLLRQVQWEFGNIQPWKWSRIWVKQKHRKIPTKIQPQQDAVGLFLVLCWGHMLTSSIPRFVKPEGSDFHTEEWYATCITTLQWWNTKRTSWSGMIKIETCEKTISECKG